MSDRINECEWPGPNLRNPGPYKDCLGSTPDGPVWCEVVPLDAAEKAFEAGVKAERERIEARMDAAEKLTEAVRGWADGYGYIPDSGLPVVEPITSDERNMVAALLAVVSTEKEASDE